MPNTRRYLRQAEQNVQAADALAGDRRHQWGVVCLFYAGLHFVNAYCHNVDPNSVPDKHGKTLNRVSRDMPSIYNDYKILKDQSEAARYRLKYHKAGEFDALKQRLSAIGTHVKESVNPPTT